MLGRASRAEVYGLFLAVLVVGGGTAYAVTNDTVSDINVTTTATPTPTDQPTTTPVPVVDSGTPLSDPTQRDPGPWVVIDGVERPTYGAQFIPAPPPQDMTKDPTPYIGDASNMFYEGRNHVCGWDYAALGGWGWGFDPSSPCNAEFLNYIASHCSANDGVIFNQRCQEWAENRLPIAY